ncbi:MULTISPECIES: type II secretion system F family protein [Pasteurellaceae]|uniref:Type II secretion system F family protein n=1 Tax=Pasteurella atlantica TaxID=2827233 RepID=A0AAW8CNN8_9PAST|nr:type II secretion system F family protein [Pasteurella atlantica]MBR0573541.1 type II secretion system F family protein [Pasteurella atlantica]MDP8039600.1 type II secretion system F family protein [Pasteurella atlantica]MDP8041691.1 type II secretion system F family protein [Pasteurella atlantica]MDP8043826.1 type II secretion system F family protein [Pasteurella atlantica]MDP8045912.1 type II secretion system F family protein [Pasteurella atlantica]
MFLYIYSLIFVFGMLLTLYAAFNFREKKKKIDPIAYTTEGFSGVWKKIQSNFVLWKFYFVGGNAKNLIRNTVITLFVFLILFYINDFYLQVERYIFVPLSCVLIILLVWKLGQRRNRIIFEDGFPEVIQILNSATTAGAGLLQALERCGKDVTGQLGEEFKRIYKRLAIGEDPTTVFEDSYTRYPYKEFYFFVTIIRVNLDKGGQMREVISRLGRVIAESKKMEQKKKAMTSEARISALIVGALPVCFFIFMRVAMPENFEFIINDPDGRLVLYYVLGSEGLGLIIIWWLMRKAS